MKQFEILPSTSEHKLRIYGRDFKELMSNALKGMFASIEPKIVSDQAIYTHQFEIRGLDRESLLINFLCEALYYSSVCHEAYQEVYFTSLSDKRAQCIIMGKKITGFATCEIKAVTHHNVHIITKDGILQTDIIFDV